MPAGLDVDSIAGEAVVPAGPGRADAVLAMITPQHAVQRELPERPAVVDIDGPKTIQTLGEHAAGIDQRAGPRPCRKGMTKSVSRNQSMASGARTSESSEQRVLAASVFPDGSNCRPRLAGRVTDCRMAPGRPKQAMPPRAVAMRSSDFAAGVQTS